MTIFEVIFVERRPTKLLNLTTLRYKSFARLWNKNGEEMSIEMPGPLDELLSTCQGVVLDIGPGSGEILTRFNHDLITAMYGAEPAEDLHPGLLKNAKKRGFGDKYHALLCGGEPETLIPALHKSGILEANGKGSVEDGIFDVICCVRVLCGVPHAEQTIKGLYTLLKPGGRMVICEHVANPWRTEGSLPARLMQIVFTLAGWPFFMGGCELQRHTPDFLRNAGEWDKFDLKYYGPKDAIPFVVGELVKKGGKSYAEAVKE
jgi:SAM-dependent methyltransferase